MGELDGSAGGGMTGLPEPVDIAESTVRKPSTGLRTALTVNVLAFVALGSAGGWLGYRIFEDRQMEAQRHQFVEAARQGALNLSTIDFATVDADIQRILDSSTGSFREDFEKRSQPFAEVVKQAQSKSEGAVTSAALASRDGDSAQVLVLMSVKMSNKGAAEPDPTTWRMRINVERAGDLAKVSDVQFVS